MNDWDVLKQLFGDNIYIHSPLGNPDRIIIYKNRAIHVISHIEVYYFGYNESIRMNLKKIYEDIHNIEKYIFERNIK